ncbi:MAG: hypothetical protein KDK91_13815 [Gammaproteobacteria bacterium]|nr:hypothetical protein [Gammaproteobacteria bacterium]
MTILARYMALVDRIQARMSLPPIVEVDFPPVEHDADRSSEFGVFVLGDGSVGLCFVLLGDTLQVLHERFEPARLVGRDPAALARELIDGDQTARTLAMGAINAIGQCVFERARFELDVDTDSIGLLAPCADDVVGMVGLFPSLPERILASGARLVVIERRPRQVLEHPRLSFSLDPSSLQACNKVLCTSSVVLNDSLDEILGHCRRTESVSVVGPTAGFLPDPLFEAGVDVVGGTRVTDAAELIRRRRAGERWMPLATKYCIRRSDYPGYEALLAAL